MTRLLVEENLTNKKICEWLNMTKTNKDIWHKTKTTLKIGDEINTGTTGKVVLGTGQNFTGFFSFLRK